MLLVQARDVYPQLLLARMGFSLGGSATATMVAAILPSMTQGASKEAGSGRGTPPRRTLAGGTVPPTFRHSMASVESGATADSERTITPLIYQSLNGRRAAGLDMPPDVDDMRTDQEGAFSPPRLAGLVGVFTGLGALLALWLFLPLPTRFMNLHGVTKGQAVADSFYVVGTVALFVAAASFIGLGGLQGEEGKGWRTLLGMQKPKEVTENAPTTHIAFLPYWRLVLDSVLLGFQDAQIGLGYLGGFVARASSVGISLFIPLYVNAYFIRNGFCKGSPNDPSSELKKECEAAYKLASMLTGISQLVALLCAPAFGYLSDRYRRFNIPLLVASVCGIVGYTAFAELTSPEVQNVEGRGGSAVVFLIVSLIGISQIGAIVCSLGLLGRGVLGDESGQNMSPQHGHSGHASDASASPIDDEVVPLLIQQLNRVKVVSRSHLKGSIAGVYSLSGGAAILLLTKLGGYLFDTLSPGAPFCMMAIFNAILLVVGLGSGIYREIRQKYYTR